MKKTYIEPSVKAIEIKASAILAGSLTDETTGAKFSPNQTTEGMDSFDADFSEE